MCNPNCADFPTAPTNNNKHIKVILLEEVGAAAILKVEEKSRDPNWSQMTNIANTNPMSPTRLTNIAFMAALLASILVNQKFINR